MLEIQKYLKTHTLAELQTEHGVYARQSAKNPKKWCLTYDQIEAKNGVRIVEECRGLVVELNFDEGGLSKDSTILALPFYRFYNHGQECAHKIDWNKAVIYNKLDGTCCTVYYDLTLKEWCVSTRSVADADMDAHDSGKTFRELFELAINDTYLLPFKEWCAKYLDIACCYVFELTTPENRLVINYDLYRAHLLMMRNLITLNECPLPSKDVWLTAKAIPIKRNIAAVIETFEILNAAENEGYVIHDGTGRIKVKHPNYNALCRLKDASTNSPRAMMGIVLSGQEDDVEPLLAPRLAKEMRRIKEGYVEFAKKNDLDWEQHRHIEIRKELAQAINKHQLNMPYLMMRYTKRCASFKEYVELHRKSGEWPNSFLDSLLFQLRKNNNDDAH